MQLKRQMVFKSVDVGRIHEQTLDLELNLVRWRKIPDGIDRSHKQNQRVVIVSSRRSLWEEKQSEW
jgi:hypothetical protein